MNIVCDENIPWCRELFGQLGNVRIQPGRTLTRDDLKDAEILLVRSVTKVNRELLEGTPVRIVASATAGIDHVDTDYLAERGIEFAYAPGSNSQSVAEYVTAALLWCSQRDGWNPQDMCIGIIGVGNVGSRVASLCTVLGMRCLLNDPPRQRTSADPQFLPLPAVLAESDIVTLHVPLNRTGPDCTYRMVDDSFLRRLKADTIFINTSRGAVVSENDLCRHARRLRAIILDVWDNEPSPDPSLVSLADIATPHIAGYSYDGKLRGALMVYQAVCRALGLMPKIPESLMPAPSCLDLTSSKSPIHDAVLRAYPIERDHLAFRRYLDLAPADRPHFFDEYRRTYPLRREFSSYKLTGLETNYRSTLQALGFTVA